MDINLDGYINVVDVQLTINLILNVASPAYSMQGDTDNDNVVDIVDIQRIVNCIVNASACN